MSGTTEYNDRLNKLNALKELDKIVYKNRFERTHTLLEALEAGEKEVRETDVIMADHKSDVQLCGRLVAFRAHGKLNFGKLQDHSGKLQVCFMKNLLEEKYLETLKLIDVGDFLGLSGELFRTNHGEITLLVKEFTVLSKTLRPLPEKWHGVKDVEIKYRQRYLDLISDKETFDRFMFRSNLIKTMRGFLEDKNFVEIETPILCPTASGALATPFHTHHKALDHEFFLRIAPETYLKRAVVGGLDRVFEFAKCFRNEGIDPSHLQEFTMLEFYAAYIDFEDNMKMTEDMFEYVMTKLFKTTKINIGGKEIDLKPPYPRKTMRELIEASSGIDIDNYLTADELRAAINEKKIKLEKADKLGRGNLIDTLYKKVARPSIISPMFVTNHPLDLSPLARVSDDNPNETDRFQLVINTWEVVNAYSELVDPIDQRQRFIDQAKAKDSGDEEAHPLDEDYLKAMEHGMPPMSGWGMGIDRIIALLTEQSNLKDCVLFPLMKPASNNEE